MWRLIVLILMFSLIVSCGSDKKREARETEKSSEVSEEQPEPVEMIPDADFQSSLDELVDARLSPYFDAEGKITELAVSPGETFDIYIFGESNEDYSLSAVEYMLSLPAGVEVIGEVKSDSTTLTYGSYKKDYMMAFKCNSVPKFFLMKYICRANQDFAGGEVEVRPGMSLNFLGFTLCDPDRTKVGARGAKAVLSLKRE